MKTLTEFREWRKSNSNSRRKHLMEFVKALFSVFYHQWPHSFRFGGQSVASWWQYFYWNSVFLYSCSVCLLYWPLNICQFKIHNECHEEMAWNEKSLFWIKWCITSIWPMGKISRCVITQIGLFVYFWFCLQSKPVAVVESLARRHFRHPFEIAVCVVCIALRSYLFFGTVFYAQSQY